jgi:two-component system sensor histidine kinase YesM
VKRSIRRLLYVLHYDVPFAKKLNRIYLAVFIIPLALINLFLASSVAGLLEKQLRYAASVNFEQTLRYLEAELSSYDTLAFTLSRIDLFQTLYENRRALGEISSNEMSLLQRDLETAVHTAISRSSVAGFAFYLDGELGILRNGTSYFGFAGIQNEVWFREMTAQFARHRRSFLLCPPAWIREGEQNQISLFRTIFSRENYWELFGLARIAIPLSRFTAILGKNAASSGGVSYLVNYQGELVASSGGGPGELPLLPYRASEPEGGWRTGDIAGRRCLIRQAPVGKYRINLVTFIPLTSIRRESVTLQMIVFMILLFLSAAAGFVFHREFSAVAARIQVVIQHMQAANSGTLSPILGRRGKDEVGQLMGNYNKMAENLRAFAEYKYQSGMELKNYELQVLQEQINPHFLYNTLEMINWLAKNGQAEKVSAAVTALARFYQAGLGDGKSSVPLQKELEHVQAYIDLQNIRFENALDYYATTAGEADSSLVPRTILQPIVENAIIHGILEKESGAGSISVRAETAGNCLWIYVEDDGAGMTLEQTERLNSTGSGARHGAANVAMRIRLLYGAAYGLSFQSAPGQGVRAVFQLPLKQNPLPGSEGLHLLGPHL